MKEHLVTHSYIDTTDLTLKCEDCNFWGHNPMTMKLHFQKTHADQKSCGFYKYESSETQQLETHIFTCEAYKCNSCGKLFKNFPDIKLHINEEHKRNTHILHSKINRDNSDHAVEIFHQSKELFRKS